MTYSERLTPPVLWWLVAFAFGLTFVIAVGAILPLEIAALSLVVLVGLVVGVLLGTAPVVGVAGGAVFAAGARLPIAETGPIKVLEGEALRLRLGVEADPRAYLVYRAFCDQAVEVQVDDAADPHPYWLVSTRNAVAFAAAVEAARGANHPQDA